MRKWKKTSEGWIKSLFPPQLMEIIEKLSDRYSNGENQNN